jgi:hypothetical protein
VACVEAVGELDGRACLIEEEARAGDVGQQLDLLSYVDAEQRGPLVVGSDAGQRHIPRLLFGDDL